MPNFRIILRSLTPTTSRFKDFCLVISILVILYLFLLLHSSPSLVVHPFAAVSTPSSTTTLHNLLFSVASSYFSLPNRVPYLRLWYVPNATRAFLFLDRRPRRHLPSFLPPIHISSNTSRFPYTFPGGLRSAVRVARIVKEAVELNQSDVHWFVFGDDDTVFFADNLVKTLAKYDHHQWYYVGSNSEDYAQNQKLSFEMAFGGGGFALSSSLAGVLARVFDSCLMRYPHVYGSDSRVFSCLAELGVSLTHEPGFHQVDARGDIFGLLSAHPLSPLVSLHHLGAVDPIFPAMSSVQALEHLFKAVNVDPGRILQQTVCYDNLNSLTVSVAWGYAVQVFDGNLLLPDLLRYLKTFRPWKRGKDALSSHFMFNIREYSNDQCKRPAVFFLESIVSDADIIRTNYTRNDIGKCSRRDAIQRLEHITVFSQRLNLDTMKVKPLQRQCCDFLKSFGSMMVISIRECKRYELISMQP